MSDIWKLYVYLQDPEGIFHVTPEDIFLNVCPNISYVRWWQCSGVFSGIFKLDDSFFHFVQFILTKHIAHLIATLSRKILRNISPPTIGSIVRFLRQYPCRFADVHEPSGCLSSLKEATKSPSKFRYASSKRVASGEWKPSKKHLELQYKCVT